MSDYSTQTPLVICGGVPEDQVPHEVGSVDEDVVGRKHGEPLAKGVTAQIQAHDLVYAMTVDEENSRLDFITIYWRGRQPGLNSIEHRINLLIQRLT